MGIKSRHKPNAEFSTSSMADIVFLLLIFFMLTSSFVTQAGVSIDLPKSESNKITPGKNSVTITEEGEYFWNSREAAPNGTVEEKRAEIAEELKIIFEDEDEENNVVTLRTDLNVIMEDAAFVISEIAFYGGKVVIATEQKK